MLLYCVILLDLLQNGPMPSKTSPPSSIKSP